MIYLQKANIFSNKSSFPKSSKVVWHSWSREIFELSQNCTSGLPYSARFALHLFVCGRGGLKKFAAEMLGTLRKSSELEICELSIDESAPERWCDGFRSGVKSACAPNLNWGADELEGEKRDRKLAPKQLWEEFRAGGNMAGMLQTEILAQSMLAHFS